MRLRYTRRALSDIQSICSYIAADNPKAARAVTLGMLLLLPLACAPVHAQLRGHGGPVRAVAVAPDGETALSGSFDSSAIRWSLTRNAALQVLRFHEGAVNAVAFL